MKIKIVVALFIFCGGLYYGVRVFGGCPPTWNVISETSFSCSNTTVDKTWRILWRDGNISTKSNSATGECSGRIFITECPPRLEEPRSFPRSINGEESEEWAQTSYNRRYNGGCVNNGHETVTVTHSCRIYGEDELECDLLCRRPSADKDSDDDYDNTSNYLEDCCWYSPIVIDILGNGFDLTSAADGVMFDFNGDGLSHRISWTSFGSDDAWLVFDRNNNGLIDSSREMFGNFTDQPASDHRNGFLALAQFDKPERGGNSDGKINRQDEIFETLRLWQDANHNGISEDSELSKLLELDVKAIELDYRESRRTDEHGNRFKYKAKVRDRREAEVGRWAFDVFLVLDQEQN